ncbi:enoyl-CoA hydratase (plasmid) [Pseudonocardia sp. EC080610-09]|nr:enoyl-CoA hydratase [Pseudonocardia sp. EC080610-09]ALL85696.1 enoyl-CoA hydratase [Pseudonocardia sp. EC080619-01]
MTSDELIRYRVEDGIGRIELNRPASLNAWTPQMGHQLLAAVRNASDDEDVRVVLVTGAGRAFSAGADVKVERDTTPDGELDLSSWLRDIYNPVVLAVREAPKPFVAAVQGACAGLGVSLALACDLVLAAEDAYFLLAFVRIAVMPDAGATSFLAERIGITRANELCMLGDKLPAEKAERWGLVNAVHSTADLHDAAEKLAGRLAVSPTVAIASMKRALNTACHTPLVEQVELEATLQQRHASTFDYAEGRAAFMAKRRPEFRGA